MDKIQHYVNTVQSFQSTFSHAHTFSPPSSMCVWEDNRSVGIDWFWAASVSLLMLESQHFLLILFSVECE